MSSCHQDTLHPPAPAQERTLVADQGKPRSLTQYSLTEPPLLPPPPPNPLLLPPTSRSRPYLPGGLLSLSPPPLLTFSMTLSRDSNTSTYLHSDWSHFYHF